VSRIDRPSRQSHPKPESADARADQRWSAACALLLALVTLILAVQSAGLAN
jgi:hypothetical protein